MFYYITLISIGNLSINTDKSTNKAFNWKLMNLLSGKVVFDISSMETGVFNLIKNLNYLFNTLYISL